MNQSSVIGASLVVAYVIFIIWKGELPCYMQTLGIATAAGCPVQLPTCGQSTSPTAAGGGGGISINPVIAAGGAGGGGISIGGINVGVKNPGINPGPGIGGGIAI